MGKALWLLQLKDWTIIAGRYSLRHADQSATTSPNIESEVVMTFQAPTLFDEEPTPEIPRTAPPPIRSGFDYGIERSADSAQKWTKEQIELVDYTIILVARRENEFTADDVWRQLPPGFPVTKGMASRLMVAARRGRIVQTGEYAKSSRGGAHDHGQRLTVWKRVQS